MRGGDDREILAGSITMSGGMERWSAVRFAGGIAVSAGGEHVFIDACGALP